MSSRKLFSGARPNHVPTLLRSVPNEFDGMEDIRTCTMSDVQRNTDCDTANDESEGGHGYSREKLPNEAAARCAEHRVTTATPPHKSNDTKKHDGHNDHVGEGENAITYKTTSCTSTKKTTTSPDDAAFGHCTKPSTTDIPHPLRVTESAEGPHGY